jgi:hypothetical protein
MIGPLQNTNSTPCLTASFSSSRLHGWILVVFFFAVGGVRLNADGFEANLHHVLHEGMSINILIIIITNAQHRQEKGHGRRRPTRSIVGIEH